MLRVSNNTPSVTYDRLTKNGRSLKEFTVRVAIRLSPPGATTLNVQETLDGLNGYREYFAGITSVRGLAEFARIEESEPDYDVIAEINALLRNIDIAVASGRNAMPTDSKGNEAAFRRNAAGGRDYAKITGPALATFRADIQSITATLS